MRQVWQGRILLALVALLPLAFTGCNGFFVPVGSGTSGTTTGDYVYVANANPSVASIAAFSVSTSGALTAVSGSPYSLSFIPTALAVTPKNTYVYVGGTSGIYAYSIGSSGVLTLVGNVGASIPVASIVLSPDGSYLYALQSNVVVGTQTTPTAYSVTIGQYQIGTSGALVLTNSAAFTTTTGSFTPKSIRISPNGGLLAVALGSAGTVTYQISNSTLSTTANVLAESNLSSDNDLAFDSTSSYLYIVRSGNTNGLAAYTASATGALQQVGTTLGAVGSQPGALALDSTGKFAYVANAGGNITGLSISNGSVPVALSSSPYSAGSQPSGLVLDNSSKFLLGINTGSSPDLESWSFNTSSTGALVAAANTTTGTDPVLPIAIAASH